MESNKVEKLNPYVTHGEKKNKIKKITVSVPVEIYESIQKERRRRVESKMRHATASEILCEAFAHAFTGQDLPKDEELYRYMSKTREEIYKNNLELEKTEATNNSMTIAETFISNREFRKIIKSIIDSTESPDAKTLHLYRLILLMTTFVLTDTVSNFVLDREAQKIYKSMEQISNYKEFKEFILKNIESKTRCSSIANEIYKIIDKKDIS